MKRTLRGATWVAVASLGLVATAVLPASAKTTTFKVDAIMANDLHMKQTPPVQLTSGGSSFDLNLVQAAINQYNVDNPKGAVLAAYQSHSSGVGRQSLLTGSYLLGFSDFPLNQGGDCDLPSPAVSGCSTYTINSGQDAVSDYVQIPVALGGVAIIYNLGNLTTAQQKQIQKHPVVLSGLVLGQIFAGKITTWSNPAIVNLQTTKHGGSTATGTILKHLTVPITVVSRTSGSGTTYGFKDYLSKVDPTDFPSTAGAAATAGCSTPVAYPNSAAFCAAGINTGSNSAVLDNLTSETAGAISYVEYSYAVLNGNPTADIINASGKTVALSAAGILADATAGLANITKHGGFNTNTLSGYSIENAKGATNYPIALFSYCIVPKNLNDYASGSVDASAMSDTTDIGSSSVTGGADEAIAIVKFLDFLTHQGGGKTPTTTFGQDLAINNGYVPLPTAMQTIARGLIQSITFNGQSVLSSTN